MAPDLVVLGLGSNMGDSRRVVLDAVTALGQILTAVRRASLYETDPLYVTEQRSFINTAVTGFFSGSPRELLSCIHRIEASFGRDRRGEQRWGQRILDIDILLFGECRKIFPAENEPELEIPHPRLAERRFALQPLLELLPDASEPGTGLLYRDICARLPPQGVKLVSESSLLQNRQSPTIL